MRQKHTLFTFSFALLVVGMCRGDVIFDVVPAGGTITVAPSQTTGWGYSIQNLTVDYLVPIGLSNSGVLYGSLADIFDYPVVDPGQTAYQQYSFNSPGGFGNSLGLFEYVAPSDIPSGLQQTGTFTLTYQFFDANPDLDFDASPIGDSFTATANFDLNSAESTAIPEPSGIFISLRAFDPLMGVLCKRARESRPTHP